MSLLSILLPLFAVTTRFNVSLTTRLHYHLYTLISVCCVAFRLLEADSKSMRSMSGSRRNSGSSLVSSSSASSNLSHLEEDTWILWGRIVNEWDEWRRKKDKLLKELIRKGIPHHFRAIVWQLLCNATDMPVKNQYSELLKMSSPCEKLIRRDIARTYPEHDFFKGQDSLGQEVLFNVMKAYSLVDREVGYCQGSAFIVGLLLMQMPEEEAFCVFVRLMQEYRLRELFKPSMAELGLCIYQFEHLLQEQLPELNVHFRSQSFHTSMYASSWFLTLFLTFLPLPIATRIFDIFMYEGLEIIFRVGIAILQYNQTDLIQLDMEGMSQHFQKVIPHQFDSCPDKLILRAYQVKYNPKRMKKLEKEYTTIKNKEMEEQIEIKRLRTENRLLKQRIETLEKYTEEFVSGLQTQLEQSRLQEAELLGALKEMQDKVLDLEKRNSSLPDEINVAQLQEELKLVKLREQETLRSFREMQEAVTDLNHCWQHHTSRGGGGGHWKESPKKNAMNELQDKLMSLRLREAQGQAELKEVKLKNLQLESQNQINCKLVVRHEQESASLQERLQNALSHNKTLQSQLNEMKRKMAESDCKSKEEVMVVRLREADCMAAIAELRQKIAELEIQKEEGLIQGQLNHSDSRQYITQLREQICFSWHLGPSLTTIKTTRKSFSPFPPFALTHTDGFDGLILWCLPTHPVTARSHALLVMILLICRKTFRDRGCESVLTFSFSCIYFPPFHLSVHVSLCLSSLVFIPLFVLILSSSLTFPLARFLCLRQCLHTNVK
uniref:Rab-GAP TBC domain-containing protein n=1 Tax=Sinocyclocheilus rhinocerous TaxID=307959 RepID=A0A673KAY0_9TELE